MRGTELALTLYGPTTILHAGGDKQWFHSIKRSARLVYAMVAVELSQRWPSLCYPNLYVVTLPVSTCRLMTTFGTVAYP